MYLSTNSSYRFIHTNNILISFLDHSPDELINVVLSITEGTSIQVTLSLICISSSWGVKLEWPQEVVDLLEVIAAFQDSTDNILNTDAAFLLQVLLYNEVIRQSDPLT